MNIFSALDIITADNGDPSEVALIYTPDWGYEPSFTISDRRADSVQIATLSQLNCINGSGVWDKDAIYEAAKWVASIKRTLALR